MARSAAAALALLLGGLAAAQEGAVAPLTVGVLRFETAVDAAGGEAASDLFAVSLYRSFPGLAVVERRQIEAALGEPLTSAGGAFGRDAARRLESGLGVEALVSGSIMALELEPGGQGGTLVMSARLSEVSSGKTLWAGSETAKVRLSSLARAWLAIPGPQPQADSVIVSKLLEAAAFELAQDMGKRLPREVLGPAGQAGGGEDAAAECAPPAFYASLVRDRDWYYGVGKDPDAERAREKALASLSMQVTGTVRRWSGAEIREIAGSRFGAGEVAEKLEALLPETSLLSGWEQDDFARCGGLSYILVRIEKERVHRFMRESAKFRRELLARLGAPAVRPGGVPLGAPSLDRRAACGEGGCEESAAERRLVDATLRKVAAGTATAADVAAVHGLFLRLFEYERDRDFLDKVIRAARPAAVVRDRTRQLAYQLAWSAALGREDWSRLFEYSGEYLRRYPGGLYSEEARNLRTNAARILMGPQA